MISTRLRDYLDSAGVPYSSHPHKPVYTAQELAQSVHIPGGEVVKSVILETDDGTLIMAVLSSNDAVNLDVLREEIGSSKLRLASETEFRDAFPTCKPGAMPPFGNLFDVSTYCEADLSRNKDIEFNGGSHDETIRMSFEDYQRLVNPRLVHFSQPYQEGRQRLAA
jgi:Ala-tRNA(Pro) deacylase